jgi:sugar phosphate isomerase/epimerase
VGAWRNLLDPDAVKRKANIEYVTRRLALAEGVGARCCVDYAGSFHPDIPWGPHPRNLSDEFFDGTVQNCRTIIDAVKPRRTKFTIEMMGWLIPDGPDSYLKLIKAVDRPEFAVHMDICNGINSPVRFYNNRSFIRECFQKLGRWTVSCHAKDLEWVPEFSVRFREVAPGRGQVDYVAYLQAIAELPREAPLMLEHLPNAELYKEGADYIRATAIKAAVELV